MRRYILIKCNKTKFEKNYPDSAKLKSQPLPKCAKIWYNKGKRIAEKTAPER